MKRMVKNETDEVKKIVQQAKIQMNTTSAKMVSEITNMLKTAEVLIDTEESQILSQINKNPRLVDGKSTRIEIKTVPALIQIRSIYQIFENHIIKKFQKSTKFLNRFKFEWKVINTKVLLHAQRSSSDIPG